MLDRFDATFIDSSGIRLMAERHGAGLVVVRGSERVMRAELVGLDEQLDLVARI